MSPGSEFRRRSRESPGGREGQIIVYQHDPDAMYVAAETFTAFLERSIQIVRDEDFVE